MCYDDDRIQNDLLDEICSDIGIKDAIDLDVFDFDANTDQYIIGQTKLPDDLDSIEQTMTFVPYPGAQQTSMAVLRYSPTLARTLLSPRRCRTVPQRAHLTCVGASLSR